ncbi:MAG: ABC transporter ATP-binding protein [Pseudoclavibacter sp.]|nr:ABC transporter ATP-binding protein [Pseudoclavibacter sp.]
MSSSTILELRGLTKRYGDSLALDHIELEVKRGEFITFLGPSGSGKTTTLNLVAGFIEASEGSMLLEGEPLEHRAAHERNLGVVFQHYALFPHLSVRANVEFPLRQRRVPRAERGRAVEQALEMVRLSDYGGRYPRQLSGGQQQRVALARALVYRPPILLMDEPLGALDKKLREWLQAELRRIHRELGSTFVYVTHDQEEALVLSDRIAVFNEGRIEQIGTARELYDRPETLFVGRFIGESSVFHGRLDGETLVSGARRFRVRGEVRGPEAAILVRPERLRIAAPDGTGLAPSATNRIEGRIEDIVYLGSSLKYTVATPAGEAIVRLGHDEPAYGAIGDEALVAWAPEDGVLLEDPDPAGTAGRAAHDGERPPGGPGSGGDGPRDGGAGAGGTAGGRWT